MNRHRKTALVAGVLYLLTFVSIPTLSLYASVRDPKYILGSGPDTGVVFGAILEMVVALACIGTAVALYPVVKRQNEGVALGFVGVRVLEASCIFVGIATLLSVVSLSQSGAGTDALATAQGFVALHDRIFLLSQSFLPAVNALLLGSLLYQSRLVCRACFLWSGSSERLSWWLPTPASCSTSGDRCRPWRALARCRSLCGSSRSGSGWSSEALARHQFSIRPAVGIRTPGLTVLLDVSVLENLLDQLAVHAPEIRLGPLADNFAFPDLHYRHAVPSHPLAGWSDTQELA